MLLGQNLLVKWLRVWESVPALDWQWPTVSMGGVGHFSACLFEEDALIRASHW